MNKEKVKRYEKINDIIKGYDDFSSEEIGLVITWSIEYLIDFHNYDFEKILDTIKRCHKKIENFKKNGEEI